MSADKSVVAIQRQQGGEIAPLSPEYIIQRRDLIRDAIDQTMQENLHWGVIPGTNQRSLLKEGAEVLLSMFHIAVQPIVTDMCTATEVRFQVECRGTHIGTGAYVGSGMGVCTSNEEKYRWRKARSPAEYDAAMPEHKRIRYNRDYQDKQVRQSPYDAFQTIMSMAKKRAMVDLAKTALAASECLKTAKSKTPENTQKDTNDKPKTPSGGSNGGPGQKNTTVPPGTAHVPNGGGSAGKPAAAQNQGAGPPKSQEPVYIDQEMIETLSRLIDNIGVPESAFLAQFELGALEELELSRFDAATAWLARQG